MAAPEAITPHAELERRLRILLPEQYQSCYEAVQPVSMGSTGLKYHADGRVAWDQIWGSFCDLAMAGGPPHRGTLLEPASHSEIEADAANYEQVVSELCRGIELVSGLGAERSHLPGWVRVYCKTVGMASWLARAIVMENISVTCDGLVINLPAGPAFRVEKEIKNVVTTVAKTCHYWTEHSSSTQHQRIANLLIKMELESPLIQPALLTSAPVSHTYEAHAHALAEAASQRIGMRASAGKYFGWLGVEYLEVPRAVTIMRLLVTRNVFSRREGTTVFVPVDPVNDPGGKRILRILDETRRAAPAPTPDV